MKSQKRVQKQPIYGSLEAMCLLRISAAIGYTCHCSHSHPLDRVEARLDVEYRTVEGFTPRSPNPYFPRLFKIFYFLYEIPSTIKSGFKYLAGRALGLAERGVNPSTVRYVEYRTVTVFYTQA